MTKIIVTMFLYQMLVFAQLGGYADKITAQPGDSISFYISSSDTNLFINIYKQETNSLKNFVIGFNNIKGGVQPLVGPVYMEGCNWKSTFSMKIPDNWIPGVYRAEFPVGDNRGKILFFVRPKELGSYSKILLVSSTNTFQAYNDFGGKSLYPSSSPDRSLKVSFLRPYKNIYGESEFNRYEGKFVEWTYKMGYKLEYATDYDCEKDASLLDNYDVVVYVGHAEYWSLKQRNRLDNFVNSGGKLIILSGNNSWWQVRYEDDGKTLVCYKAANLDPYFNVNNAEVTVNWFAAPVSNPENKLIGTSFRTGGYVNDRGLLLSANGYGDFTAFNTNHWIYANTNLDEGDEFGFEHAIVGNEVDGIRYKYENGIAVPTGADSAKLNTRILGLTPASNTNSNGAMVFYHANNGGMVFNASTMKWVNGMNDTIVSTITNNILKKFSEGRYPPEITSWTPSIVDTIIRNNTEYQRNYRYIKISGVSVIDFSINAVDPGGEQLNYFWKVDNTIIGSSIPMFKYFVVDNSEHFITAYAYNSKDTSSISWKINGKPLSVDNSNLNLDYSLGQNYPNPFNGQTIIKYMLKESGIVRLKIFDILGNEVVSLLNEEKEAGEHNITLDTQKLNLSSGIYYYTLTTNNFTKTKKMVLIK